MAIFNPDARLLAMGAEYDRIEALMIESFHGFAKVEQGPADALADWHRRADEIDDQWRAIRQRIVEAPAHTLAGLGVKAKPAAQFAHGSLTANSPDHGEQSIFDLLKVVFNLTGAETPYWLQMKKEGVQS